MTPRHFTSLREFLGALRDLGDLREVNFEVDTELEIGAIVRPVHETYAGATVHEHSRLAWLSRGGRAARLQFLTEGPDGTCGACPRT